MVECRAAFYARVSSEAQARDHTIASQAAALRERAVVDGAVMDPDHAFIDEGHSGSSLVHVQGACCARCRRQISVAKRLLPTLISHRSSAEIALACSGEVLCEWREA